MRCSWQSRMKACTRQSDFIQPIWTSSPSRLSRKSRNLPNTRKWSQSARLDWTITGSRKPSKRTVQREILKRQLAFAASVNKPVIIHMREEKDAWFGDASADLLEILSAWHSNLKIKNPALAERPGVLHSFNGTLETAQKAIAMKFFIGVTGPVTYKNAEEKRNIIRQLPITQLLIETDSPFLSPVPHRGKRNEPAFVGEIADKIAEIHSRSLEEVAATTTANAARLFLW